MGKKPLGHIILAVILGALIGGLMGKLIAFALPGGVVKEFFLKSIDLNLGPVDVGLGLVGFTLGFRITLNVVGVLGIGVALYFLRWY